MLRIRFINVADGDAILVEDIRENWVYRLLVDTGRVELPVDRQSKRRRCVDFLRREKIDSIDTLVVTHLHADHAGGLGPLLAKLRVGKIISGYIPQRPSRMLRYDKHAPKSVIGMVNCVNQWNRNINHYRKLDGITREVSESILDLPLTDKLSVDIIVPFPEMTAKQKAIWDGMADNRRFPMDEKYAASKGRNPASLRVRVHYAGREVELSGDCYGEIWENADFKPCDIFKVPHHGDQKAVTETLLDRLNPAYAVISCANNYIRRKDRPSLKVAEGLRNRGAQVWYTDNFDDGVTPPVKCASVDFTIDENGNITAPV